MANGNSLSNRKINIKGLDLLDDKQAKFVKYWLSGLYPTPKEAMDVAGYGTATKVDYVLGNVDVVRVLKLNPHLVEQMETANLGRAMMRRVDPLGVCPDLINRSTKVIKTAIAADECWQKKDWKNYIKLLDMLCKIQNHYAPEVVLNLHADVDYERVHDIYRNLKEY